MTTTTKPEPGPKPKWLVVEKKLYWQTDEGEIVLDMRLSIAKLEMLMKPPAGLEDESYPRFLLDHIVRPDEKTFLEGLQDGTEALAALQKFAELAGERLGASLGESAGSTDSSESTERPSATTSEPASE